MGLARSRPWSAFVTRRRLLLGDHDRRERARLNLEWTRHQLTGAPLVRSPFDIDWRIGVLWVRLLQPDARGQAAQDHIRCRVRGR